MSGFGTKTIHSNQPPNALHGGVTPGIELSTTFAQKSLDNPPEFTYSRYGNPTRNILEKLIADLEYAKYGISFGSGSAAITSCVSILQNGDNILVCSDVWGGTNNIIKNISKKLFGMTSNFVDFSGENGVNNLLYALRKYKPKMLWLETPTNPTLMVLDLPKLIRAAKGYDKNIITVVDNTFASPYNLNPIKFGCDIVMHSITKYLNGHSDVCMGIAVTNDKDLYERLKYVQTSIGSVPSPFDCFMTIRGLKTLHVRMEAHAKNALQLATFLELHPKVERVFYPHLKSHPQYDIAKKLMKNGSGMISILLKGGIAESKQFLSSLKLFKFAVSLGGTESMACHPAIQTHYTLTKKERMKLGIKDNFIRLSIGIEDAKDLINDLSNALDNVKLSSNM